MKKLIIIIVAVCFLMACASAPQKDVALVDSVAPPADDKTVMEKTKEALKTASEWLKDSVGDVFIDPSVIIK